MDFVYSLSRRVISGLFYVDDLKIGTNAIYEFPGNNDSIEVAHLQAMTIAIATRS